MVSAHFDQVQASFVLCFVLHFVGCGMRLLLACGISDMQVKTSRLKRLLSATHLRLAHKGDGRQRSVTGSMARVAETLC